MLDEKPVSGRGYIAIWLPLWKAVSAGAGGIQQCSGATVFNCIPFNYLIHLNYLIHRLVNYNYCLVYSSFCKY